MNSGQRHYNTSGSGYTSPRMPFGKHAGARIADVPSPYLVWFVSTTSPDYDLRQAIERELDARNRGSERKYEAPPTTRSKQLPAGVTIEAALKVIESGRRAAAKTAHPDKGGKTADMQVINQVADFLRELLAEVL